MNKKLEKQKDGTEIHGENNRVAKKDRVNLVSVIDISKAFDYINHFRDGYNIILL